MRDGVQTVVAALWASLGLAPPRDDAEDKAVLRIDGRSVGFAPSPDRTHLVITATVGTLASDPYRRNEQVRRLLRDSLGMVLANRAGLQLGEGGAGVVQVVAVGPCRANEVPLLRELIEDVLHLADIHTTTLAPDTRSDKTVLQPDWSSGGESLIFRL